MITFISYFNCFSQEKLNRLNQHGLKDGVWIQMDSKGNVISIADYSNGIKDGLFLHFDTTGLIKSDTFYSAGVVKDGKQYFLDSANESETYKGRSGRINLSANKYGILDWANFSDGYTHGLMSIYVQKYNQFEIHVNYWGRPIYFILFDDKIIPRGYYSLLGLNRDYVIRGCYVSKVGKKNNVLTIEFENPNDYKVCVPSLKSRTLSYYKRPQKLFHELYWQKGDTLFVQLINDYRDNYRYYADALGGGRRHIEQNQRNVRHAKFMENTIYPHQSSSESVKIYSHGVYIRLVALVIEDETYIFRNTNYPELRSPAKITP